MLSRFATRTFALLAAVGAGPVVLTGCGGPPACPAPVYDGTTMSVGCDEAWRAMVDAESRIMTGSPSAVTMVVPTQGQIFSGAAPAPQWSWTSPIVSRDGARPRVRVAAAPRRSIPTPSLLDRISNYFIGTAWAHCAPLTGAVYYLHVGIPGRTCDYTVLTTNLYWQVDDPAWQAMRAVSNQDISVRIVSAYMMANMITEGPYQPASPTTFRIGP